MWRLEAHATGLKSDGRTAFPFFHIHLFQLIFILISIFSITMFSVECSMCILLLYSYTRFLQLQYQVTDCNCTSNSLRRRTSLQVSRDQARTPCTCWFVCTQPACCLTNSYMPIIAAVLALKLPRECVPNVGISTVASHAESNSSTTPCLGVRARGSRVWGRVSAVGAYRASGEGWGVRGGRVNAGGHQGRDLLIGR